MTREIEGKIAGDLRAAYDGATIAPFAHELGVGDVAAAYRVQEINTALWEAGGRRIVGRKIGLTAPAVQAQFGVHEPGLRHFFADRQVADGATVETRLIRPRIEAEVAFMMGAAVTDPEISNT